MRLTLRTLLGWIDDALPPEEHRLIGERVAGSRFATRLADRIRDVVVCGSVDVPWTGGPGFADDPNVVAEYLDNTLASEHLATFERHCIESEPHLAEVADCHRLLAELFRSPQLARLPREQRHGLRQRIRKSLTPAETARSEEASREAAPAEQSPAKPVGHADARAAAEALVEAMLRKPSRPLKPVQRDEGWQAPVAAMAGLLPAWHRPADSAAGEPVANGCAATAAPVDAGPVEPAVAAPESARSPAPATRSRTRLPAWTAWVTAALTLAILLAAGGALTSPLRSPKTYAPEPGCMHCTKP